MEFLPAGQTAERNSPRNNGHSRARRACFRSAAVASAAALLAVIAPSGVASARPAASPPASLQALLAQATTLSNQIDSLGQQYDALQIQYQQAKAEAQAAQETAARDKKALAAGQVAVAQIADQGYMTGSINPTIQLLQSDSPQDLLNRSSILMQLNHQQNGKLSLLSQAEAAANRATKTAAEEENKANQLAQAMQAKVDAIQSRENQLNSQAYAQAMSIFQQTGTYPDITIAGDSVGVQALKWALTRLGDPYVWAAAGPDAFDCSGLTMWAYAHVGINLDHFTGDQWNEGQHISRAQLQPGDLVFFFADISHVGIYMGDGYMVDAPSAGQDVQVQPVFWSAYEGGVRPL